MSQGYQPPAQALPSSIQPLLNPAPTLICDSLPDYLTNSMIHVLRESSRTAVNRRRQSEQELEAAGINLGAGQGPKAAASNDVEAEVEVALKERLEGIGRVVGAQMVEQ